MKPSSISATTQSVSTSESLWIERSAHEVISRMIPRWLWTLLILTMLFSVHCGGEEVCPSGTGGEPCKPIGDLGPQPEVPTTPDSHLADAENGDADSVADTHTKDMDQHDLKVGDGSDTHPPRAMDANDDSDGLSTPTDDTEQADATRESASHFGHLDSTAKHSGGHPNTLC